MADCLFCSIVARKIPAKIVHEDADTVAFQDINPQAPTHLLVVPRKHIPTMSDLAGDDEAIVGKMFRTAAKLAGDRGHAAPGFRVVMNQNRDAGQTVFHIHLHVLGGRHFGWPPG